MTPVSFDGIVALCSAAGFSPNIVNTSATWPGVLTLVEFGEGIAIVPSGVCYLRSSGVVISPLVPQSLYMGSLSPGTRITTGRSFRTSCDSSAKTRSAFSASTATKPSFRQAADGNRPSRCFKI